MQIHYLNNYQSLISTADQPYLPEKPKMMISTHRLSECTISTNRSSFCEKVGHFFVNLGDLIWNVICTIFCCSKSHTDSLTLSPEAKEMFRRIPQNEWKEIEKKILSLQKTDSKVYQARVTVFHKEEYTDELFNDEQWPLYAMQAYANGDLAEQKYVSLMLYQAVTKAPKSHLGSIQNLVTDVSKNLFIEGLQDFFTKKEIDIFFRALNGWKMENQYFFAIHQPDFALDEALLEQKYNAGILSITEGLHHNNFFTLFIVPDPNEGATQLIIPPHLIDALMQAKFGANAMKCHPVNGYSDVEDFKSAEMRDVYIPNVHVKTPEKIHGLFCKPLDMYYHDAVYHIWVESGNMHRPIYINLAKLLKEKNKIFYEECLDREFKLYSSEADQIRFLGRPMSLVENFWVGILLLSEAMEQKHKQNVNDFYFPIVFEYIYQNQLHLKDTYNIDFESMKSFFKGTLFNFDEEHPFKATITSFWTHYLKFESTYMKTRSS